MRRVLDKYKNLPVPVKATVWFLVASFLQRGIQALTTPIFTRLLSTSEYGQFSVFNSWLGITTAIVSLNIWGGIYQQGLVKFSDNRKMFSSSLQGLTLTLTVGWTAIYLLFHSFWNGLFGLTTVQMLAMLVLVWTSSVFNFWAAEQRNDYKYKELVLVTLLVSFGKPIIGIIFVKIATDKVTARILGLVLVELCVYLFLFISQMRQGKVFFDRKYWKYAVVLCIPLVPHYLSQTVLNSADRIMISNMVGDSEAGIYSLAYSISQIMILFNTALMSTLNPWIFTKIKEKKNNEIGPVAYISLIVIAAVNLGLILIAPEAVAIFAPASYYEAIYVIPPVAMGVYFLYSYDLFSKFAFYYEKTYFVTIVSIFGAILNIILNYIFIKTFGYIAAGYTTLVCYIVYCFGHYMFMRKIVNDKCNGVQPYSVKVYLEITFAFLLIGFLLLLTYDYQIIRYAIIIVAFAFLIIYRKTILDMIKSMMKLKNEGKV